MRDLESFKKDLLRSSGKEVRLGFELLHMKERRDFPGGYRTLWQFVRRELSSERMPQTGHQTQRYPHYSTLTRWMRAAEYLGDRKDPRALKGVSWLLAQRRLDELRPVGRGRVSAEREQMSLAELQGEVAKHRRRWDRRPKEVCDDVAKQVASRVLEHGGRSGVQFSLQDVTSKYGTTRSIRIDGPPASASAALGVMSQVVDELETVRNAWRKRRDSDSGGMTVPPPAPLEVIRELRPGQLTASWSADGCSVSILKEGETILVLPVERVPRVRGRIVIAEGNTKTRSEFAIIDSIAHGCLRICTGLAKCDHPCFTVPGDSGSGCYVNQTRWAKRLRNRRNDYNVIHNGLVNDCLRIRIPHDGKSDLSSFRQERWRVDSESGEGSLSISLGILQTWAQSNPDKYFCTMCSHTFRPSDAMLAWTASLGRVWVGHTLSAGLSEEDVEMRLAALKRFREFRIPYVVWLVTHHGWENEALLLRLKNDEEVTPDHIIECPLRHGLDRQEFPRLGIQACGNYRVDRRNTLHLLDWERDFDSGGFTLMMDGRPLPKRPPALHSKCAGCDVRCGYERFRSRLLSD